MRPLELALYMGAFRPFTTPVGEGAQAVAGYEARRWRRQWPPAPPITGATMVTGVGDSADETSTNVPALMAACTCAARVKGVVAKSTAPGLDSTRRTRVQAPV